MKEKIINYIKIIIFVLYPCYKVLSFFGILSNKYISFLIIPCILLFIILYKNQEKINLKKKIWLIITSSLYSIFYVYGTYIDITQNNHFVNFLFNDFIDKLLYIFSFASLIYILLKKITNYLENIKEEKKTLTIKSFLIILSVMFCAWLPFLISYYPGMMSPDSLYQWCQAIGECPITNHHPVVHTLLIKIFATIGELFNNANLGVALYSIFQMLILSTGISYIIFSLLKKENNKIILIILTLYYSLVPIFGYYSITMWKDIIFGVLIGILALQIFKFTNNDSLAKSDKVITLLTVLGASLFRTNGKFVVVALIIILAIFYRKRIKEILLLFILPAVLALVIIGPVYDLLNFPEGNFTEAVGAPLKQIAGVIAEGNPLDKDDKDFISKIVPINTIKEKYDPNSIDNVKFSDDFDDEFLAENKGEFFKVWLKYLFKYPVDYIEIYLRSTYGFWYIESTGYITHRWSIVENEYNLSSITPFDKLGIEKHFNIFYSAPIIKYLMSDALCLWIIIYSIGLSIYKKSKQSIITLCVPLIVWLSIMVAAPVSYQPRYTFSLFCCMPIVIKIIINLLKKEEK